MDTKKKFVPLNQNEERLKIKIQKIADNNKIILHIMSNTISSVDLNIDIEAEVNEIHIMCDYLNIDHDLPQSYCGKNIFVFAGTINILKKSVWNLSGQNAHQKIFGNLQQNELGEGISGEKGEAGKNGGNCKINYDEIVNPYFWKIISDGGHGSDGQNGGDGKDGPNGLDVQLENFTILGEKVTNSNYLELLTKFGLDTENKSQRIFFYENGMEKLIIFNQKKEMLMLIKGSKGMPGTLGGLGGRGGRGGFAGKVNVDRNVTLTNGVDGHDGLSGYNGRDGVDGRDAFMIIRSYDKEPIYGGLNSHSKIEIADSLHFLENSIFYESLNKFFYANPVQELQETFERSRNSLETQIARLRSDERNLIESLISVLKFANQNLPKIIEDLKIKEFLNQEIDSKAFAKEILKYTYDVREYDTLKHYAVYFTSRKLYSSTEIQEIVKKLVQKSLTTTKNGAVCNIKKGVITSELINSNFLSNFDEIKAKCDVFHINSNLSDEFRGKGLAIRANLVIVHRKVDWNLSGWHAISNWTENLGQGINGKNGQDGENGGDIVIICDSIINSSFLTINVNGGNGSDGQNGGDGNEAVDGTKPTLTDFLIHGQEIDERFLKSITNWKTIRENNLEKQIFVENPETYLVLIKGSPGKQRMRGGIGGQGGFGGHAGEIKLEIETNGNDFEGQKIEIKGMNGKDGISGKNGKSEYKNGCDAFLYVENGIKTYIGLDKFYQFQIWGSEHRREYSVFIKGRYFYPKRTHIMKDLLVKSIEINYYENLVSVLRNSFDQFGELVRKLQLQEFANNQISLQDVAAKVLKYEFGITHYSELKRLSSTYKFENTITPGIIRQKIAEFLQPIQRTLSSNTIEIKRKILLSTDFTSMKFSPHIKEFHVICDTFHINSILPSQFQEKNIVILSNFVEIHIPCIWDLSGLPVTANSFVSDAGKDENGKGNDGEDGMAGRNGGHFILNCRFIENGSALTIVTKGSNGTDGQDAGDGTDGDNGRDANEDDFNVGDYVLKQPLDYLGKYKESDNFRLLYDEYEGFKRGNYKTNNGLTAEFYFSEATLICLVKGGTAKKGTLGGLGGYGGDPGYPGEIKLNCYSNDNILINKVEENGITGKAGINGLNGIQGIEGRDIWKFDYGFYRTPNIYGTSKKVKYRIVRDYSSKWWKVFSRGINQVKGEKIYSKEEKCYIKVEESCAVSHPSSRRCRNDSTLARSKREHAIAKKNASVDVNAIEQNSSEYLNESMDEILHDASLQEEQQSTSSSVRTRSEKKSKIDSLYKDLEKFDNNYLSTISELSNDEQEKLLDKFKVSTTRQVTYDKKKKNKNKRKFQKITRDSSENVNYQMIKSQNVQKTVTECFDYLRHSKLEAEEYRSIVNNLQNLNILENEHKFKFSIDVLKKLKGGIIDENEEGDDNEQLQYYIDSIDLNSLINYLNYAMQGLTGKNKMTLEDIQNLCEEKHLQLFYAEIYKNFNQMNESNKTCQISFCSPDFSEQFRFLKHSNNLQLNDFNSYLNAVSEQQKHELVKYFNENCKNIQSPFPESLFNLLINCRDEFQEIQGMLEEFYLKARGIDDDFFKKAETIKENVEIQPFLNLKSSTKAKFMSLLNEFYKKKEIINFIKNDVMNNGSNSMIYRRIVAFKCDYKFVICKHNLSNKLKICEWHNYGDDLRFKYENTILQESAELEIKSEEPAKLSLPTEPEALENNQKEIEESLTASKTKPEPGIISRMYKYGKNFFNKQEEQDDQKPAHLQEEPYETTKEFFILSEYEKFSILKFDDKKYENLKIKKHIDKIFKEIVANMQSLGKNSTLVSQESVELPDHLIEKFKIKKNKFLDIFDEYDLTADENLLFQIVISNFPQNYIKIDSKDLELFELDAESSSKIEHLYPKNDEQDRARIKCLFMLIAKLDGTSILKAIATRLHNDKNIQSLEEFSILLKSIFEILRKNEGFVMTLTFMILGNEQEMWTSEIILMKLDSILGGINKSIRNKWKNIFEANKHSAILSIFLDKISNLNKDQNVEEEFTVKDVDDIIVNINYFDDSMTENLMETDLRMWGLITTDKYWTINLDELKKHQKSSNINFDEVKRLFEDLFNKHGIKLRKMMEILQENKLDLVNVNLKTFLANFNTGKWLLGDHIFAILRKNPVNQWIKKIDEYFTSEKELRDAEKIADIIKNNDDTSPNIKEKVDNIKAQVKEISKYFKKFDKYNEYEIQEWIRCQSSPSQTELLALISKVFKLKIGFPLRDTQLISVLTMCNSNDGVLMQVSTGEGKTFIGVAFAVLKVLQQQKIDIVTSSSVLAERDAIDKDNKKIFDFFNIKVDHNCHDDTERRKLAYKCDIIYGTLCNFQRDYLLTAFHDQKLMTGHHFRNILIDEVDSMLLDKGNNILYLSQDLPNLDEIECIFIFIWQWINQSYSKFEEASKIFDTELIRKIVLDNIYGILDEDDIKKMESDVDAEKIIKILKSADVIDDENLIQKENYKMSEISLKLNEFDEDLVEKINIYLEDKIKKDKQLKLPKHLKPFILQHLNQWIENGVRALFLINGKEYVIDRPNTGLREEHLVVNIIDLDTGTDMKNSQWDEGLHQFLQIKYGCKLSSISLKSVFISNVTFFKRYTNLYGMTGTLGSLQEREKMMKIHKIDFVTIPRFISRNYEEYLPIVQSNQKDYIDNICEEVEIMCMNNRTILIICETIEETRIIEKAVKKVEGVKKLFLYQRDSDVLDIKELEAGFVIISTNLAGRGTDFKLSKMVKDFGGLHVILTNLPDNSRIEEQAFGRAARSGEKGSGRLIIYTEENTSITKLKEIRNQEELKRLDEVSKYYENFITIEEELAAKFQAAYGELKKKLSRNQQIYLSNFITQWSFWLDKNSTLLEDWKNTNKRSILLNNFKIFLEQNKVLHPVMRIELFKELVGKGGKSWRKKEGDIKEEYSRAKKILSDDFHDDLFVHHYFQLYGLLRKNQADNDFKVRELTDEEHLQIRTCIGMLYSSMDNRQMKIQLVKYLKEKYQEGSLEKEGFEAQQKEILDVYNEILRSLKSLLGEDINPDVLNLTEIDKDVMRNELYQELLKLDCITYPQISKFLNLKVIENISKTHNISFKNLNKFLHENRNTKIKSMKIFQDDLKKAFSMPSRGGFWDELLKLNILTNEIEYATINMNILNNVDPSAGEIIKQIVSNEDPFVPSPSKIYFAMINPNGEADSKVTLKMSLLKTTLSSKRFDYLMENSVIEVNKEANFDVLKFNSLKNSKIFGNYDEIQRKDFKVICMNYDRIIEKLTSPEINLLTSRSQNSFALNFENLESILNPYDLDEDYVYQPRIYELIKSKFSYRFALESLADDITNGTFNPIIRLEISPHLNLLNDLMSNLIIEQSKVDETKIEKCEKIFDNSSVIDMFKNAGLDVDSKLIHELWQRDFLDDNYRIKMFDIENAKLSMKYQQIESTVKLLLQNRRILIENAKNVKTHLKNFVKPLLNKELDRLEVVLVPIQNFLQDNKFIGFMDLKGLGAIIKVQQQMYSAAYWKRFFWVLGIALFQIVVGVAITLLTKGLALKFGSTLINEGVGDAIFALSSLQTGYFSWSDYRKHKMISVATSVFLFVGEIGFSKVKWFKKASDATKAGVAEVTEIGATVGGTLSEQTGTQLIKNFKSVGLKKVVKETAFKTVISCKNALIQAGVGMAADYAIKKFLNQITMAIGDEMASIISKDFSTHAISSTIDDLLCFFEPNTLQKLIMEKFQKMKEASEHYAKIHTQISSFADSIVRSDQNTYKCVTLVTSAMTKIISLGLVTKFVRQMYDKLDWLLNEVLKTKRDEDRINESAPNNVDELKADILKQLKHEAAVQYRNSVNANIVKPILVFTGTAITKKAIEGIENIVKDSIAQRREAKLIERTHQLIEAINENKKSKNTDEIPDDLIKEAIDIQMKTKNPETFKKIMKENTLLDEIGMECTRIAMEKEFGQKFMFVVKHKGVAHELGKSNDPNVKIIELDLVDGHFLNNSNESSGNNCLYHAINDKYPELSKKFTSEDQLRNAAANVIDTNETIRSAIANYDKEFQHQIGLFGGDQGQNGKRISGTGSQLAYDHQNRTKTEPKLNIHHGPTLGGLKGTPFEATRGKGYAMVTSKAEHDQYSSTGNSAEAKKYRQVEKELLNEGNYNGAVDLSDIDMHNTKVAMLNERLADENFNVSQYFDNFHNDLRNKRIMIYKEERKLIKKHSKENPHEPYPEPIKMSKQDLMKGLETIDKLNKHKGLYYEPNDMKYVPGIPYRKIPTGKQSKGKSKATKSNEVKEKKN